MNKKAMYTCGALLLLSCTQMLGQRDEVNNWRVEKTGSFETRRFLSSSHQRFSQSGRFEIHVDTNGGGGATDEFRVSSGRNRANILTVNPVDTKVKSTNFSFDGTGRFRLNLDNNGNSTTVDDFQIYQGASGGSQIVKLNKSQMSFTTDHFSFKGANSFFLHIDANKNNASNDVFAVYYGNDVAKQLFRVARDEVRVKTPKFIANNVRFNDVDASYIVARSVRLSVSSFPDYVFSDTYTLPTLTEVESFIKKNKHLPKMPSEKEVLAKGMDLKQINTLLVEKVEELTLYTIAQDKELKDQKRVLEALSQQLKELQEVVKALKK